MDWSGWMPELIISGVQLHVGIPDVRYLMLEYLFEMR